DSPTYLGTPTMMSASVISGTNISYLWDYGDGSDGSGTVSPHTYPALGSYTATVTATNERNSETATTQVTIIEQPISGLNASSDSPTHLGNPTHLTADVLTGSSVSYAWDFGDGTPGSGATPSHVYPGLGIYTAIVTATNSLGFASADTVITVVDMPISGLIAANDSPTVIGGLTTLTAAITAGTHVSYSWNFGDGTSGSGAVETHTYAAVGVYTAVVTAINGSNTLTASTTVRITDVPVSGLVAQNDSPTVLGGITTVTASIVNGTGVTYSWDFGDGSSGTGQITTHKYTAAGTFTATVTATNSAGDVAATTQVTIVPADNYLVFLPTTAK
ncbi:MAG TPA: PKD domain-containing protein, partial [Anaerolineales bacterium]